MTIEYKIQENDFLTYQLFVASNSENIKKKRQRNKLIWPIIYIASGVFFLFQDQVLLSASFIAIGLLWYFIYPIWEKRRYIRHYERFIKENYEYRFGQSATLEFNDEYLFAKDNGTESKMMTTEFEEIYEIPTIIIIKLKGGQSLILPKNGIVDLEKVKARLKELAKHLEIKYITDEKWEWK